MALHLPQLRGRGAHRSATPAELRAENATLLARQTAADDYFALLTADRNEVYRLWQAAERKAADAEQVVACQDATIREQNTEITRLRAELANATPHTVPAGHRDVDPDDQPTQPIPLWDAHNPAHIPAWARPHTA